MRPKAGLELQKQKQKIFSTQYMPTPSDAATKMQHGDQKQTENLLTDTYADARSEEPFLHGVAARKRY